MEPESRGEAWMMDQKAREASSEASPERKFRLLGSKEKFSLDNI